MSKRDPVNDDAVLEGLKSAVVLMVDDEPTTLEVLGIFLESEGYRDVVKVTDPRKVLETIEGLKPDVVLLNLGMPHVSGLEILAAMQDDPKLRSIPSLIITGSTDPALKRQAVDLGAADFLAKPIDPSELSLRLKNTLASRAYREGQSPRAAPPASPLAVPARAPTEERILTIVDTFLGRLQPRLEQLEACLAANDFEGIAELAHWLKGAGGTVGLHEFTEPAAILGRLAGERRAEPMARIIESLRGMATEAEPRERD